MTTVAILQARSSSARLPGKVLLSILGVPMLSRQIDRIGRAKSLDGIVVATSTDTDDILLGIIDPAQLASAPKSADRSRTR